MKRKALTFVMLLFGALLIVGGALTFFPSELFPLDKWMGQQASVAAIALGTGMAVAAFDPVANVSWVRIGILYGLLVIVYEIVVSSFLGVPFNWGPTVFGVVMAVLLIVLYPRPAELLPPVMGKVSATPA
jgi:hypothetical protein